MSIGQPERETQHRLATWTTKQPHELSKVVGTLRVPLYFYPYLHSFSVNKNPEKRHWVRAPFYAIVDPIWVHPIGMFST